MKYRHRPTEVEAVQWFKSGDHEAVGVAFKNLDTGGLDPCRPFGDGSVAVPAIKTLEGWHEVTPGDWIVRGIANEYYPVKDAIFRATYEVAE